MHHKWEELIEFVCKTTNGKPQGQLLTKSPIELTENSEASQVLWFLSALLKNTTKQQIGIVPGQRHHQAL